MVLPTRLVPLDVMQAWVDCCQVYTAAGVQDPRVRCAALVELAASVPADLSIAQRDTARALLNDAWRRLLCDLLPEDAGPWRVDADARVARAVAEIDRRHADPRLRLRALARQLAVSDSRLTQMLKEATGLTFGARLHARRVAEARRLLIESTLSIKEIASRVGYSTTTQLDRHFKRIARTSPSRFRMLLRRGAAATQSHTQQQI